MYEHYQQLQNQFKTVHKEVDQLRASKSRPGELRREISQLEEESQQLTEKIANLKKKTSSDRASRAAGCDQRAAEGAGGAGQVGGEEA